MKMISKYNHKELNWIDLESPKKEEIEHVLEKYTIPTLIKNYLSSPKIDDKIEINNEYIYISIYNKIIFFVSDDLVLSIHNTHLTAIDQFTKEMELDMVSNEKINSNWLLFAYLLKNLYINFDNELVTNIQKIQKQ